MISSLNSLCSSPSWRENVEHSSCGHEASRRPSRGVTGRLLLQTAQNLFIKSICSPQHVKQGSLCSSIAVHHTYRRYIGPKCSAETDGLSNSITTLEDHVKSSVEISSQSIPLEIQSQSLPLRAAFFDVDGTITKSNVVVAFLIARLAELPLIVKVFWVPYFALNGLLYLALDRIDRALFNRVFYRNYQGRSTQTKEAMAALVHKEYLQPKTFGGALEHIKMLKSAGFKIVLVTGSLDFLVAPLATELGVDAVFAARLKEQDGKFTGELEGDAVSSAEKAILVRAYAAEHEVSLEDSRAYGDSIADLAMLEAVGYPFAVKPDSRLQAVALQRGWPILDWSTEGTTATILSANS